MRSPRRNFLSAAAGRPPVDRQEPSPGKRPRIAAVVTEYRHRSHACHILDRFLWGYGWNGKHHYPPMDLVSLYVDQFPKSDLGRSRVKLFPHLEIYPSIAQALTLGGDRLAVDGVLLIGEHGNYPNNEKGQKLYPRYEFFQEIVRVFRKSGRTVPLFNDKHLSWNWEWAREMVDTAREMRFSFLAGSSLPVSRRLPPVEIPADAEVEEVVCTGAGGGMDGYGIHVLEAIQGMVERRRGGETGVRWLHAVQGENVWEAMRTGSWEKGRWDLELFEACLCRTHHLPSAREGFNHRLPSLEEIPGQHIPNQAPVACRYRHADGMKVTMLLIEGVMHGFSFAARLKGRRKPLSLYWYLPGNVLANFFNPQVNMIEKLFLTGEAPFPIERTLLTTGLTAAGVESIWRGQIRLETPHLAIQYQSAAESTFWRS